MKHDPVEAMLADLIADYLDHCTLIYPESHEPANCAAALARLVKHAHAQVLSAAKQSPLLQKGLTMQRAKNSKNREDIFCAFTFD